MLRPFSRFCIMIGAIPESIIHSLSYEQQLLRLIKFLKQTVIPAIDGNTTAIKKIEEWIENVDLQEFVDNKLDEMVESGELQEIISEYLNSQAIFAFDSVEDMKSATNLINGSYAKTTGYYSKNDKGGALYKIRTVTNEDTENDMDIIAMNDETLVAEFISDGSIIPEQFGAKGDGTTDTTDILSYVFTYAGINKLSIKLSGLYYITKKLEINLGTSVVVYGSKSQIGSTISGSTTNFANFKLDTNGVIEINGTTNITFDNVGFNGNNKAIILKSFRNRILNCGFNGFDTAITFDEGTNWTGENVIDKCCFNTVTHCIVLNNGSDSDISNCLVDGRCTTFITGGYDGGFKITNNHDYSTSGSVINGFNCQIVGNYFDGWNKLTISGNGGFNITANLFIGSSPVSGTNSGIIFTHANVTNGNITGNIISSNVLNAQNEYLYFLNINACTYFSGVTISGNNTRICKKLYYGATGSKILLTNLQQDIKISGTIVNNKATLDKCYTTYENGKAICYAKILLDGLATDEVLRWSNLFSSTISHIKMNNSDTVYTVLRNDNKVYAQGAYATATSMEVWTIGIVDNSDVISSL